MEGTMRKFIQVLAAVSLCVCAGVCVAFATYAGATYIARDKDTIPAAESIESKNSWGTTEALMISDRLVDDSSDTTSVRVQGGNSNPVVSGI